MNNSKAISKDSLKDLYNESKKRVKMILHLLARFHKETQTFILPDTQTLNTMSGLTLQIINSAHLEPDNQYRNAIIHIATWMETALNPTFISSHEHEPQHPLFVVKKGAEILHSFLHRDLRRKQFSSEENEIYQNYLELLRKYSHSTV